MKAAIYSPYLDIFGGGERYMMTIAEILSSYSLVDVLLDNNLENLNIENFKKDLAKRFNLDLSKVNFIKAPFGKGSNFFSRLPFLMKYDLLFYLTDGSIFYPTAKRNILHIQSPLMGQPSQNWWGKFKLSAWDLIIYNSQFTKHYSEKDWPQTSKIIYPPVDVEKIKPLKKRNFILSVGRFSGYLKDKKQKVLIKVFKDLYQSRKINGWSLHLVGSAGKGDTSYINELKNIAKGLPVNFYPNLSYDSLRKLYGESKIYWHALGFEEDDPTKMEHFGITTVEAMAAGCVPIVIAKGGQIEIVEHHKNGFLWTSLDELKKYTLKLIMEVGFEQISKKAQEKAKHFSKDKFAQKVKEITND